MSIFLILAYLFFIGSSLGWVLELFYRRFAPDNLNHKWINPGFCVGPYVPLYGFGLCILYLFASWGDRHGAAGQSGEKDIILFILMAASMTLIEYIAGVICLKWLKVRLWDYSNEWGNIQGIICPKFSFFWAVLGAAYYFLIHTRILDALKWLSENLAFSFFIGYFFGVFTLDVIYSARIIAKLKHFAEEYQVIVRYENLKEYIQKSREQAKQRSRFLFAFRAGRDLLEYLKTAYDKAHDNLGNVIEHALKK